MAGHCLVLQSWVRRPGRSSTTLYLLLLLLHLLLLLFLLLGIDFTQSSQLRSHDHCSPAHICLFWPSHLNKETLDSSLVQTSHPVTIYSNLSSWKPSIHIWPSIHQQDHGISYPIMQYQSIWEKGGNFQSKNIILQILFGEKLKYNLPNVRRGGVP